MDARLTLTLTTTTILNTPPSTSYHRDIIQKMQVELCGFNTTALVNVCHFTGRGSWLTEGQTFGLVMLVHPISMSFSEAK